MRRPERLLLLRSGRHLKVALTALDAYSPGCRIGVVGTPGAEAAFDQAGIAPEDRFLYHGGRFQPLAFSFGRTAREARRWGFDRVAVLWNDPEGTGQGNVDRTALVLSPRGYLAVTPDGTIVERALLPQVRTELMRAAASVAVGAALGAFLYAPGLVAEMVGRATGSRNGTKAP
jgi:hypothetical protein